LFKLIVVNTVNITFEHDNILELFIFFVRPLPLLTYHRREQHYFPPLHVTANR